MFQAMTTATIAHLQRQGKAPGTVETYAKILNRLGDSDPAAFVQRSARNAQMGTVLPLRAAVQHYLVAEKGLSEAEARAIVPQVKGGPERTREALAPAQLDAYTIQVAELPMGPMRVLLQLLPRTGLRISEATGLRWADIVVHGETRGLDIVGKRRKRRFVPLSAPTCDLLDTYRAWLASWTASRGAIANEYVFPGYGDTPLSPAAAQKALRLLRAAHPELGMVTPHILRHTYATRLIRADVDIRRVQVLLGHSRISTTERYLHPTAGDLADAVNRLDMP